MKKLIVTLLLFVSTVAYSQGVGYLNYTVYNIISNGAGQYANSATDFVNMFDTTKGATVYARGTALCNSALLDFVNKWTVAGVPNGGAYTGIKIYGYFVPKETGTYSFYINGDDGVDFSIDGTVVTSFYGPHGFGANHYGTISLVAGKSYAFMARYQNWGGGWGMDLEWKRPSQTTWSIQSNEVTSTAPAVPTKKAVANFNFNSAIDPTKFSIGSTALSSAGSVDITTSLDSNKIVSGYKATIVGGGVEWSYVNLFNGVSTLYIDMRKFGNVVPNTVNSVSILDVYTGPVTFSTSDGTWAQYTIPSNLTNLPTSTNQYIRNAGYGNYAFACDVTFAANMVYKPQSVSLTTTNNLTTLYTSIVTVSDVYLAFQEYTNQGLFGNQTGTSFTRGIQYQNADIDGNKIFIITKLDRCKTDC
jgi:PA14 domain